MESTLRNINNALNSMGTDDNINTVDFHGYPIRITVRNGLVWFVASDVAAVLGYRDAPSMTRMLSSNEMNTTHNVCSIPTRGNPNITLINEPGLYKCIFNSRRPEAVEFQNWVYCVLLPSVRQYGTYISDDALEELRANPNLINDLHQRIMDLESTGGKALFDSDVDFNETSYTDYEIERLSSENKQLTDVINERNKTIAQLSKENNSLNHNISNMNEDLSVRDRVLGYNDTCIDMFNTLVEEISKRMRDKGYISNS